MSKVISGRRPFQRDPQLDYELDSDEEWEAEGEGEDIDASELDDDKETGEQPAEEEEDGWMVPDGYLSNDEGQVDEEDKRNKEEDEMAGTDRIKLLQSKQKVLVNGSLKTCVVGCVWQLKEGDEQYEKLAKYKMEIFVGKSLELVFCGRTDKWFFRSTHSQ